MKLTKWLISLLLKMDYIIFSFHLSDLNINLSDVTYSLLEINLILAKLMQYR